MFENANSPKVVVTVLFFPSPTLPALSIRAKFTLRPGQFGDDHDGKGGLEVRTPSDLHVYSALIKNPSLAQNPRHPVEMWWWLLVLRGREGLSQHTSLRKQNMFPQMAPLLSRTHWTNTSRRNGQMALKMLSLFWTFPTLNLPINKYSIHCPLLYFVPRASALPCVKGQAAECVENALAPSHNLNYSCHSYFLRAGKCCLFHTEVFHFLVFCLFPWTWTFLKWLSLPVGKTLKWQLTFFSMLYVQSLTLFELSHTHFQVFKKTTSQICLEVPKLA